MKILKLPCTTQNDLFGTDYPPRSFEQHIHVVKNQTLFQFNERTLEQPEEKIATDIRSIIVVTQKKVIFNNKDDETQVNVYDIASKKIEQSWHDYPDAIYMIHYSASKIFSKSFYTLINYELPDDYYLMCFDKNTFEMLWKHKFDCDFKYTLNGDRLYILDWNHNFMCWDKDTREVIWQTIYKDPAGDGFEEGGSVAKGYYSEPSIHENILVFYLLHRHIVGLDKNTGKQLWCTERLEKPLVFAGNKAYTYQHKTFEITVFDLITGQVLEKTQLSDMIKFKKRHLNRHAYCKNIVVTETHIWLFFGDGGHSLTTKMLAINLHKKEKIDWYKIIKGGYRKDSAHAHNNRIYFSAGDEQKGLKAFSYLIEGGGGYTNEAQYTQQKTNTLNNEHSECLQTIFKAPFAIFYAVATAHGVIDDKKTAAFITFLKSGLDSDYPFVCSLVNGSLKNSSDSLLLLVDNKMDVDTVLAQTKTLLLTEWVWWDYEAYLRFLIELAVHIAQPSGGFLGFGQKVSDDELQAIERIKSLLL